MAIRLRTERNTHAGLARRCFRFATDHRVAIAKAPVMARYNGSYGSNNQTGVGTRNPDPGRNTATRTNDHGSQDGLWCSQELPSARSDTATITPQAKRQT